MGEVIAWLNKRLPDDAIVTNGAGNYAAFLHRFFQYRGFKHPARADQRRHGLRRAGGGRGQDRRIPTAWWCRLAGDGCFLMNGQEFATAVQHGANIVITWSTTACTARSACTRSASIRRACIGTELKNPDFAAYARAFGGHGETVEKTEDFAPRLRARAGGGQARDHPCEDRPRGADLAHHADASCASRRWPRQKH